MRCKGLMVLDEAHRGIRKNLIFPHSTKASSHPSLLAK